MLLYQSYPSTVQGDYAELRFLFLTSSLPATHTSKDWQDALNSAIISEIQSSYLLAYPLSYAEVEGMGITRNTSSNEPAPLSVRSEGQEFLFVNLNLLPASLSPHDIEIIRNVS